jgi:hypothetical protein
MNGPEHPATWQLFTNNPTRLTAQQHRDTVPPAGRAGRASNDLADGARQLVLRRENRHSGFASSGPLEVGDWCRKHRLQLGWINAKPARQRADQISPGI